jgi:serine/threonine protein kinase
VVSRWQGDENRVTSDQQELVGQTVLGRYRVVMPLGRGGQGVVYLARGEGAAGFARPVVIKRAFGAMASDRAGLAAFAREARITSQLRHPNIVSVIDFAPEGHAHLMVLEYVHGYDLRRWSSFVAQQGRSFAPAVAGHAMLHVLEALHYAHTLRAPDGSPRRVVHRDISPANVMVDLDGHVKLTDFGVARMEAEDVTVTTSGMHIKGKLAYVAPELYLGAEPSAATDLYACGVMLHEWLRGKNEFRGKSVLETMMLAREHVATRLSVARSDVNRAYADVVEQALAKDPAARFGSALAFKEALSAALRSERHDVAARFRKAVREDFTNPAMARFLEVPPLSELDTIWRNASDLADQLEPEPRVAPSPGRGIARARKSSALTALTVIASPLSRRLRDSLRPAAETPHAKPTRSPGWRALVPALALALVALALLSWHMLREAEPRLVYLQRELGARDAADARPSAGEIVPAAATGELLLRTAEGEKPRSLRTSSQRRAAALDKKRAQRLSVAFAQRRAEVARCFDRHAADVAGQPGVEVEFAIQADGRVASAFVVPTTLRSTRFARCLVAAALDTRFGPQPSRLRVRIPVTARVVH